MKRKSTVTREVAHDHPTRAVAHDHPARAAAHDHPARAAAHDHPARAVAHDFNNLLTAIIGTADAVLARTGLDPETVADMTQIRDAAWRGTSLVRMLRGEDVPLAEGGVIFVNAAIRALSRLLAHRLGAAIPLTLALPDRDERANIAQSAFDRVLLNLIVNAGQAMPDGGAVTISTARRVLKAAETRLPDLIPAGDYVVIGVGDTGPGVPPDALPRLFEAGFTTSRDRGGSGLGLASVLGVVRRAGGFLSVDSAVGKGTRFDIYLTRDAGAAVPARSAGPSSAVGTVLLVEDDLLVRRVAERILVRAGWAVVGADSAEQALRILSVSPCDMMISDVAMPGLDGFALTRLVLAGRPDLPVILTSGYESASQRHDGLGGNVTYLTKPYDRHDLLAAVARHFAAGSHDA